MIQQEKETDARHSTPDQQSADHEADGRARRLTRLMDDRDDPVHFLLSWNNGNIHTVVRCGTTDSTCLHAMAFPSHPLAEAWGRYEVRRVSARSPTATAMRLSLDAAASHYDVSGGPRLDS